MRALIIEEKEVKNLIDRLALKKMRIREGGGLIPEEEMHKRFHYEVVKWFQEQGMDKVY